MVIHVFPTVRIDGASMQLSHTSESPECRIVGTILFFNRSGPANRTLI